MASERRVDKDGKTYTKGLHACSSRCCIFTCMVYVGIFMLSFVHVRVHARTINLKRNSSIFMAAPENGIKLSGAGTSC